MVVEEAVRRVHLVVLGEQHHKVAVQEVMVMELQMLQEQVEQLILVVVEVAHWELLLLEVVVQE